MKHCNAVALLKSLRTMLDACLDEHRCQGIDFDRKAWAGLRDLGESPAFVKAFARLDQRPEDRVLLAELSRLITDVVGVAQTEQDFSPEDHEKQLHEAYPLFAEADLHDEADDAAKRIRNLRKTAAVAKSPPAKPTGSRPGVVRQRVFDAIADWADIKKIEAETGFSQTRIRGVLTARDLQSRIDRRAAGNGRLEFKLKK